MKTFLVLGGGIGGVEAAISLVKEFKGKDYRIELVSERDELFIYPLSVWIPVGKRTPAQVSMSVSELAKKRGFTFHQEKVESIEAKHNRVITDQKTHSYDYLIVALGADKLRPQGVEHTLSICGGAEETVKIGERFSRLVPDGGTIACGFSGNPKDGSAVRGGPVFEILFNLDHQLRRLKKRDQFNLIFFSPSPDAGKRLGGPGLKTLEKLFAKHNIKPMLGKKIKEFRKDGILWEDDQFTPTALTLFTPGMQGPSVLKKSDLPLSEAGFVPVNDFGQVMGNHGEASFDNCYVIGDSAAFTGPEWRAKQGHLAEVMAHVAVKNIALREKGKPQQDVFSKHFNILCVMDLGNKAVFVYRDERRAFAPVGIWAHWAKIGWEWYYKLNKKGLVPSLPL